MNSIDRDDDETPSEMPDERVWKLTSLPKNIEDVTMKSDVDPNADVGPDEHETPPASERESRRTILGLEKVERIFDSIKEPLIDQFFGVGLREHEVPPDFEQQSNRSKFSPEDAQRIFHGDSHRDEIRHFLGWLRSASGIRKSGRIAFQRSERRLGDIERACVTASPGETTYTARYRIASNAALGTLIALFVRDVQRISTGAGGDAGIRQLGRERIAQYLRAEPVSFLKSSGLQLSEIGLLTNAILTLFERIVTEIFGDSDRTKIVLFAEVVAGRVDADVARDWEEVVEVLLDRLPPNVVIVVSGVPEAYIIPFDRANVLRLDLKGDDGASDLGHGLSLKFSPASLEPDSPASVDSIDVGSYAEALACFLLHESTRPPLTIGIHAQWGKGKSSFMGMIRRFVVENFEKVVTSPFGMLASKPRGSVTSVWSRRHTLHLAIVNFNAWQYNSAEQVWAGLASRICGALERSLPLSRRILLRIGYVWKHRRAEFIVRMLLPVIIALGFSIWLLLDPALRAAVQDGLKLANSANAAGAVVAFLMLSAFGTVRIMKAVQPVSDRLANYMKLPEHKAQMGYQHRVLEDLAFVHERFRKRFPDSKVVVFVDDLDRCSDEKIMEVLQAVNLVLADCGFFVLLSMDTEMVYRSIRAHYTKQTSEPVPGDFAENYLRKIVQLSFHLPKTPPEKLFNLASSMFSDTSRRLLRIVSEAEDAYPIPENPSRFTGKYNRDAPSDPPPDGVPSSANEAQLSKQAESVDGVRFDLTAAQPLDIRENVDDTPEELTAFHDYKEFLVDNPREIKRLVNVHRLVKIILQKKEGWSVVHQRLLVKWVIFQFRWPDVVNDLERAAKEYPTHSDCIGRVLLQSNLDAVECAELNRFSRMKNEWFSADIVREFAPATHLTQMVRNPPPVPIESRRLITLRD